MNTSKKETLKVSIVVTYETLDFITAAIPFYANSIVQDLQEQMAQHILDVLSESKFHCHEETDPVVEPAKPTEPYGTKNDGTPRAKPGRKSKKKAHK